MRRLVARFEDEGDAEEARAELRDADLEPERPDFDNPLSDPAASVPEERGLAVGGLVGGAIGVVVFSTAYLNLFVVPRFSPMMSADPLSLLVLGLGLGVVVGGFVGGAIGTLRPIARPDGPTVGVAVPDDRTDEAEDILRSHDAAAVEGRTTYHENPGMWETKSKG